MNKCLIISGGKISDELLKNQIVENVFDLIIVADKGIEACDRNEIIPDFMIGDYDSASKAIVDKYKKICPSKTLNTHKDVTDTEDAIDYAIEMKSDYVVIIGATGTRLDHTMANIGLLKKLTDNNIDAYILDENNRISMKNESFYLRRDDKFPFVSLIPYGGRVENVTLKGFEYSAESIDFEMGDSLGISNSISSDNAFVDFRNGYIICIESRD